VVDEIKLKAPNWSRDGSRSILAMLNRAQNFAFKKPTTISTYIDPATGDYPFLATATPTRDYEIPDVNIEVDPDVGPVPIRISNIFEIFSENIILNDYGAMTAISRYIKEIEGTKVNWKFTPKPALQDKRARVIFPFDPGTYPERYKMRAVIEPLQLTSDSIPLMVPQDDEEMLIEGALGYIEYFDYGRSDRMDKFERQLAPEFWAKYRGIYTPRQPSGTLRRKF
jgi:hypothetical protein